MSTATIERTTSAPVVPRADRFQSLDGLRGLACLVVLLHHTMLTIPVFAAASSDPVAMRASANPIELALTWSPLHLVWEGTGAVWVFFVLSGFVLVRQVRDPASFDWFAYYPQRLVRLYAPVFAAIALAAVLIMLFGGADHDTAASAWMQRRADDVTLRGVLSDATLIDGAGFTVSPLWSLQWEVWFSLLLPLFVFVVRPGRAARRPGWVLATAPLAAVATALLGGAEFLPVFAVGAVLAVVHERLETAIAFVARRRASGAVLWGGCALWVAVMLPARWTLSGVGAIPGWLHTPLSISAAAIVVVMALHCRAANHALTTRVLLWFGAVSFSLYLVHEPIVVALAKLFGDGRLWIALPIGIVLAIAVAAGFWFAVERPATALSRRIGRAVRGRRILTPPVPSA